MIPGGLQLHITIQKSYGTTRGRHAYETGLNLVRARTKFSILPEVPKYGNTNP
eukprot:SAG31_NODE_21396_length_550_cov_1.705100_1_plen_52_part_10